MSQEGDDILLAPQSEDSGSDTTTMPNKLEIQAPIEQHHRLRREFEERRAALLDCMEALAEAEAPTELAKSTEGGIHELAYEFIQTLEEKFPPLSAHSKNDVDAMAVITTTADLKNAEPGQSSTSPVKTSIQELPTFTPAPIFNPELLEPFNGNKNEYSTWEAKTEIVMNAYADPAWRIAVLTALPSKLKDDAASWLLVRWKDLQGKSGSVYGHLSWELLRDDMRRHFRRPEEEAEQLADEWTWAFLPPDKESAANYLVSKLSSYKAMARYPSEERLVAKIRAGMPANLQNFVPTSIQSVDEIVDLLISQEPVWRRTSSNQKK